MSDRLDEIESESKKSNFVFIGAVVLGVILLTALFLFNPFESGSSEENISGVNVSEVNGSLQGNSSGVNGTGVNETSGDLNVSVNGTVGNLTEGNLSDGNVSENVSCLENRSVSNPTGSVKILKIRSEDGEYYCDNVSNPEHGIRIYTYKLIEGVKNLSVNFIDSDKMSNVCSYYDNSSWGMNYFFRWEWEPVECIDGYRIYQYYSLNGSVRNYNYYVDMKKDAKLLTDMGLDSWIS